MYLAGIIDGVVAAITGVSPAAEASTPPTPPPCTTVTPGGSHCPQATLEVDGSLLCPHGRAEEDNHHGWASWRRDFAAKLIFSELWSWEKVDSRPIHGPTRPLELAFLSDGTIAFADRPFDIHSFTR